MEKRYPFKFLDAYNQNDTDIYFGRDEEIAALYEMVFQNPILLVYGASGTGKTSLIQCGLAGRFKSYDWLALTIRRGTDINVSLKKVLAEAGGDDLDEEESLSKDSSKKLPGLLRLIKGVYLNNFKPIYLIFDQFEELYILGTKDEQEKFIEAVKEILKAEQPVKMIFSIREEYLGHLFEFEKQIPQLLRKKLRVEPMTLNKVADVINGINNSARSNVRIKTDEINAITQGIFERLRGKKNTLTIQLPYLQVFLDKLYLETTNDETRKADALIELSVLNRIGDIGDVLRNFLEEQVAGISKKLSTGNRVVNPETTWRILSPFSTLEGTKEPISKKELSERLKDIDPALINEAVESFVNSRIVNYSEASNLYELAHDSLALRIAEKRSDEEISLLEVRRLIKNQVSLKQDVKELFSKKQLNAIDPYLSKLTLSKEESQLIAQSRKAIDKYETKTRTRRRRLLITITAITIIVIGALSYLLIQASIEKKRNKYLLANNYWNNSKSEKAANDYVYALANAAEAIALSGDNALAKKILIDVEHHWPLVTLNNIIADQSQLSIGAYDSAGTIITVGKDFMIRKWDSVSGKQISQKRLDVQPKSEIIGFTGDISKILTIDSNNHLHISYVNNGKEDPVFSKLDSIVYNKQHPQAFNHDGTKFIQYEFDTDYFSFFDFKSSKAPKQIEHKLDYDDNLSSLVLKRDAGEFMYLINDTSLFIGTIGKGTIRKLPLKIFDLKRHQDYPEGIKMEKPFNSPLSWASFSSEENVIITAGKDNTVRLWDSNNGTSIGGEFKHKAHVQIAFLIPSTNRVFVVDDEGSTYIWDRTTTTLLGQGPKFESVETSISFRRDGKQLVIVENNTIFTWDVLQKIYTGNNELMNTELLNAAYSPDLAKVVVPDSFNDTLVFQLLDPATRTKIGEDLKVIKKFTEEEINFLLINGKNIFSPDNKKLLTQISDSTMILWDVEKQKQIGNRFIPCKTKLNEYVLYEEFTVPVFSPDSKKILAFNDANIAQLIDAETGRQIGKSVRFDNSADEQAESVILYISEHIIFSPDSSKFLTNRIYYDNSKASDEHGQITVPDKMGISSATQLWNVKTGQPIGKKIINELYVGEDRHVYLGSDNNLPDFNFDGKSFMTFSNAGFQIWDTEKGTQIGKDISYKSFWSPFLSVDKKTVLAAINDSTVQYFDAGSGKPIDILIRNRSASAAPVISPDGKWIITFQMDGGIEFLNAESGKEMWDNTDFKHHRFDVVPCFSDDASMFVTIDQAGFLRLWDSKTGKQKGPAMRPRSGLIEEVVFSTDGKKILTRVAENDDVLSPTYTAVLWDSETGKQIREGFQMDFSHRIRSSTVGHLIAIGAFYGKDQLSAVHKLVPVETGDLDIPSELLKLQVYLVSGYRFDFETTEKIPLTPLEFREIKTKYNMLAASHYKNCKYHNYNFWKRFNEEDAKKIRNENKYSAVEFKILPQFQQPADTTQKINNGSFLRPNQGIKSNNGEYLLVYQRDGDLVVYKKEGMEPIWSSGTAGYGVYRTVMQFDGNLVIYSSNPDITLGKNAIWASNTNGNDDAKLILQDDGNLVIQNKQNKIIWQSNSQNSKVTMD